MEEPATMTHDGRPRGRDDIQTWHLLLGSVALTLFVNWYTNEFMLTREMYQTMLGAQLDESRIDTIFESFRRGQWIGYWGTPLFVLLRIAFVALLMQLPAMMMMWDIQTSRIFRAVTVGYFALLGGTLLRAVIVANRPAGADPGYTLVQVPGSLASVLMNEAAYRTPLFTFLNLVNPFELTWVVIVAELICREFEGPRGRVYALVGSTWLALTSLQWAITWYLTRAFA